MITSIWKKISSTIAAVTIGGLATINATMALADNYPSKPVTLVVGFPPGGSTDVVARILAKNMTETLGQPVLVENRAGAGGSVGIGHVSNSAPDGYTLGVSGVGASILLNALGRKTGYNIDTDLDVIGVMGTLGLVIAGRNGLEPKSLPDLIQFTKDNPGKLTYGSSGIGTPGHLAMEYLKTVANVDLLHIPYKGNTPLMNDILGGHVDIALLTTPGTAEQVRAGGVHPYAVTSPERSSLMPHVPTAIESGFDGYTATLWNLLVTPEGTPADVQMKLSKALNAAMKDEEVLASYKKKGLAPTIKTPQEATKFLETERAKWKKVISEAGVEKK